MLALLYLHAYPPPLFLVCVKEVGSDVVLGRTEYKEEEQKDVSRSFTEIIKKKQIA